MNDSVIQIDDLLFLILVPQTTFVLNCSFKNDANHLRWMGSCFKKSTVIRDDNTTYISCQKYAYVSFRSKFTMGPERVKW